MSRSIVRCRCGHQVLSKEVLRTDLYERSAGREYVYIKYRCARCKRMGQSFVPEHRWDWTMLEPARNEMSTAERDRFLDVTPISDSDVAEFHAQLESVGSLAEWDRQLSAEQTTSSTTGSGRPENARPENIRLRPMGEENNRKSPNPSPNKGSNGDNLGEETR